MGIFVYFFQENPKCNSQWIIFGVATVQNFTPQKKLFNGGNEMDIVKNDNFFEMDECCEKSRDF
jgi:hypothetical protein